MVSLLRSSSSSVSSPSLSKSKARGISLIGATAKAPTTRMACTASLLTCFRLRLSNKAMLSS